MSESAVPAPLVARVTDRCRKVLDANWREGKLADGRRFAYTCPSPRHYPWQWYWDSCFTALAWRHFDRSRGERELRSLLSAERSDGFIGHTIFWDQPLPRLRRYLYNLPANSPAVGAPKQGAPMMTASIQPPALAWAWEQVVGAPAQEPAIVRHYEWLAQHRDLDGDGLLWIVQPDESGLDASPQFDAIWGAEAHGLPGFYRLVQRNRRLGFDLRRVLRSGHPVCAEVATNVLYSLSRTALGLPSLTRTLIERCYDERRGLFLPLARPAPKSALPVTWAALSPLALPDLPEAIGHRLVREHLLDERRFWLPAGVPSVSASEPSFETGDGGPFWGYPRRYWRGPVWINAALLLWRGLVRLGYREQARVLAARLAASIDRVGLREYYHPYSGAGEGQRDFAWSAVVLELLGDLDGSQ